MRRMLAARIDISQGSRRLSRHFRGAVRCQVLQRWQRATDAQRCSNFEVVGVRQASQAAGRLRSHVKANLRLLLGQGVH